MNIENKKWYVLHTRPNWEKKAAYLLERQNIEVFCPLTKQERRWSDRKKVILTPLFKSYVFVYIDEVDISRVKMIGGNLNFVYWLNKPAVIREEEISVLKKFENDYSIISLEKSAVNVDDRVRILNGPMMEREGKVLEVLNKTFRIVLPTLGYHLIVQVESTNIEKVKVILIDQTQSNVG